MTEAASDDALDRVVAEAMGWTEIAERVPGEVSGMPPGDEPAFLSVMPSPTRSPADFVALMEWHAREGRRWALVTDGTGKWFVREVLCTTHDSESGEVRYDCKHLSGGDTMGRAAALATAAWKKGGGR